MYVHIDVQCTVYSIPSVRRHYLLKKLNPGILIRVINLNYLATSSVRT